MIVITFLSDTEIKQHLKLNMVCLALAWNVEKLDRARIRKTKKQAQDEILFLFWRIKL